MPGLSNAHSDILIRSPVYYDTTKIAKLSYSFNVILPLRDIEQLTLLLPFRLTLVFGTDLHSQFLVTTFNLSVFLCIWLCVEDIRHKSSAENPNPLSGCFSEGPLNSSSFIHQLRLPCYPIHYHQKKYRT